MAHPSPSAPAHPPLSKNGNLSSPRAGLWLLAGLLLATPAVLALEDSLRTVQKAAAKWVDLRTENSRLDTEWVTQKPLLESFVHALDDRIVTLETKRDFLTAKSATDTGELAAIEAANRLGLAETQAAAARVKAVADQLIRLRAALPPRLSAALEMSYRSLAKPDSSVNDRMQFATLILSRCQQFNHDISYGQDVLVVPGEDGERVLDVIYWGLGQGYALDRVTRKAWSGRPGAPGWTWQPQPDATAAITKLMDIRQDKADPAFVTLPAQLNGALEAAKP